jgi:hypothetical protein
VPIQRVVLDLKLVCDADRFAQLPFASLLVRERSSECASLFVIQRGEQ